MNLGKFKEAQDLFDKIISIDKESAEAYVCQVQMVKNDSLHQAIQFYNKSIELDPNYFRVYNLKGNALANLGKCEESCECYQKSLELNHHFSMTHMNLGILCSNLGRKEEALQSYNRAIQQDPKNILAYHNKGIY
ncbi:hypothetical protein ABPG72_018516 [Tetrahymena utriculariae]